MKWFKHETSDRNKVESKLIKARFGIEGYGIYQSLLEVIGETIEQANFKDWGHVDQMHDINTLSDECCVTPEVLKEFLIFCDEKGIFEKHKGRLFSRLILRRLDEWAERINSVKNKDDKTRESLGSHSGVTRARVEENRVDKNRIEEKEKKPENSQTFLENLPEEFIITLLEKYNTTRKGIIDLGEKLNNYCLAKGKKYSNYKAFYLNAAKRDFTEKNDSDKERQKRIEESKIRSPLAPSLEALKSKMLMK